LRFSAAECVVQSLEAMRWANACLFLFAACGPAVHPEASVRVDADGALVGSMQRVPVSTLAVELDATDRRFAAEVLERAPEDAARTWINPDSGTRWEIRPLTGHGECRTFALEARIWGRPEKAEAVACREPGGDWRLLA
jgi:surface antigen